MSAIGTDRHDSHALRLRIELLGIQPTVYRQVIVPASITLSKLHQVIQAAMGWKHRIAVEDALPIDPTLKHLTCTDGAHACPPEDVGGAPGYMDFLHAITDRTHPEHGAMRDWHGGEFDSRAFDAEAANGRLRRIKL